MKKILLVVVLAVALVAPAFAILPTTFEAGKDNPDIFIPRYVNSYLKDYVVTVHFSLADAETTVNANHVKYFMVPEAAELMYAWVMFQDSVITDTVTNYNKYEIWRDTTTADTGLVAVTTSTISMDTVMYWTLSAGHKVQHPGRYNLTKTATNNDWCFPKAGVGACKVTGAATETEMPKEFTFYMLFRPKSSPSFRNADKVNDYYTQ